jgi:type IV secretion system protein TrbJ
MRCYFVAVLMAVGAVPAAHAQFGFLGIPAQEWTQILNNAQLIAANVTMAQQLADAIRNSARGGPTYGNAANELAQLAQIMTYGRSLSYSMSNIDAVFRQRYPGYARQHGDNYYTLYRGWAQTSLDTSNASLQGAGLSYSYLRTVQGIIGTLRGALSESDGRLKAMMAAGAIADQQTEQLEHLRTLMLADLQSKQAYQGYQVQKDAAQAAAAEEFFNYQARPADGMTFGAGWR